MWMLLVLACAGDDDGGKVGDSGVDEADADTDTDTDTDSDTDTDTDCALTNPMGFTSVDDVEAAAYYAFPPIVSLTTATYWALNDAESDGACPIVTRDESTGSFSIEGDCTNADGYTFGGSLRWVATGTETVVTYDAFSYDSGDGASHFDADGTWSNTEGASLQVAMDLAYDLHLSDAIWDGTYVYAMTAYDDGTSWGADGYVSVVESPLGVAGDFCVDWAESDLADEVCATQGDGTLTMTGASVAVVTDDGSTACDGCAPVTVDGVDVGEICAE